MTCYLTMHVLDRETMLPLDLDIPFGVNKSAWSEIMKVAILEKGIGIKFHQSEQDPRSLQGVRCWWTDDPKDVRLLALHIQDEGALERNAPGNMAHWEGRLGQFRFFFELI